MRIDCYSAVGQRPQRSFAKAVELVDHDWLTTTVNGTSFIRPSVDRGFIRRMAVR